MYIYVECGDCDWSAMCVGMGDADTRIQRHQFENDGHYVYKRQL